MKNKEILKKCGFEKQVKVYKSTIINDNGWHKTVHEAKEFELKDI